jgi:hypothetical protein
MLITSASTPTTPPEAGSVFKFGYEEDFHQIKDYIIDILSVENSFQKFYK